MGILDVTLTNMETDHEGNYILYGVNMTANSKVYINGNKQSTTFINDTRIELKKSNLDEGDKLVVCQVGSSSRIFRTSVEYVYTQGGLVLASEYVPPIEETPEETQGQETTSPETP